MNKLKNYVEETWTELDYETGITEKTIILPIIKKEDYKPLPWVKYYKFFDLEKDTKQRLNQSPIIFNKNYNPFYFMDNQNKMIKENKIELEIIHYVKEIWIEIDYLSKQIIKKEVLLPITKREEYFPLQGVKKYSFIDCIKITSNNKITIDKTPLAETNTYINHAFKLSYSKKSITEDNLNYKNNKILSKKKALASINRNKVASN